MFTSDRLVLILRFQIFIPNNQRLKIPKLQNIQTKSSWSWTARFGEKDVIRYQFYYRYNNELKTAYRSIIALVGRSVRLTKDWYVLVKITDRH